VLGPRAHWGRFSGLLSWARDLAEPGHVEAFEPFNDREPFQRMSPLSPLCPHAARERGACHGDEAYDANVMHFWRGAGDGVGTTPA
jgi:hypothetical protein